MLAAALPGPAATPRARTADLRPAPPAPGWAAGVSALRGGRSATASDREAAGPKLLDWTFLGDPGGDGLLEGRRLPGGGWHVRLRDLAPVAYLQHAGVLAAGPGDETVV